MDRMYTPDQAERVSRLRHERWNLLARFAEKHSSQDSEWSQMNNRMRKITQELYELTGNPIYHVQG